MEATNEELAATIRMAPVIGGPDVDLSRPLARHLQDNYVLIPRYAVPVVGEDEWGGINAPAGYHQQIRDLEGSQRYSQRYSTRYWLMALLDIARAEYGEKEAAARASRKEVEALARRRDELASEFTAVNSYNGQLPYTQKLIDRIISLEEAAK